MSDDYPEPTITECAELARRPGSFYDMVRAIYRAGAQAERQRAARAEAGDDPRIAAARAGVRTDAAVGGRLREKS